MCLADIYSKLLNEYGPQGWWPGDTGFEICVGAILTQQTAWTNVEKAISRMKEDGVLSCHALAKIPLAELEEITFSTGFYRQKSKRLQSFCKYLMVNYEGNVQGLLGKGLDTARRELLDMKGIGGETADSMLLYAGEHPIFVIDAYTHRLLERIGKGVGESYDAAQTMFHDQVGKDMNTYREYHALIVEHCKQRCLKKIPLCDGCPIGPSCSFFADK